MNRNRVLMFGLLLAPSAFAADFGSRPVGPLSNAADHLWHGPLATAVYHLNLDFVQSTAQDNQIVERRAQLAIGLPARVELGLALLDTQEFMIDHASRPLGGYAWLRWTMLKADGYSLSANLQYQPGVSTRESLYQASQDRTTLGFDFKAQPFDYLSTAVYAHYSFRHDERVGNLALGSEVLFGARLAVGTSHYGAFCDGAQRRLSSRNVVYGGSKSLFAKNFQAGLYAGFGDFQASAFALIPDRNREAGIPERGFGASISLTIGGPSHAIDPRDQPGDAIKAVNKAENEAAALAQTAKEPEIKILETNEMDDFQQLERKEKQAARNQKETANEKAERQMREALEAEKKLEAQKAIERERAQKEEAKAAQQKIRDNDAKYQEYRDEVNEEINRYTLPDKEELNWNGLQK